jgi:hypothetical protein
MRLQPQTLTILFCPKRYVFVVLIQNAVIVICFVNYRAAHERALERKRARYLFYAPSQQLLRQKLKLGWPRISLSLCTYFIGKKMYENGSFRSSLLLFLYEMRASGGFGSYHRRSSLDLHTTPSAIVPGKFSVEKWCHHQMYFREYRSAQHVSLHHINGGKIVSPILVASGEKARWTHKMPRLHCLVINRGRRAISGVLLDFSPEATNSPYRVVLYEFLRRSVVPALH